MENNSLPPEGIVKNIIVSIGGENPVSFDFIEWAVLKAIFSTDTLVQFLGYVELELPIHIFTCSVLSGLWFWDNHLLNI